MFVKHKKKQSLRNNEYFDMQNVFDKLYQQSRKGKRFANLLDIITAENNILLAYRNIKSNKGSRTSGVDKRNISSINNTDVSALVEKVQSMFQNYRPQKVKRVEIPKSDGSGRVRPLGIPTIRDRLIQQCILQVLEPICEAKFSDNSYGFRPNRSCENAISKAMHCMQQKHLHYCVDIDIKSFFDNVNHAKLLKQMWALGIQDKNLLCIISKILNSEIILPDGQVIQSTKGTPQGGIISPLLSNIVLNELDRWIENQWCTKDIKEVTPSFNSNGNRNRGNEYASMRRRTKLKEMHIVRYADDFKIFTRDYQTAKKIFEAVKLWLKERLDLYISPEKSRITNLERNYTVFLGFKLKVTPKGKKMVVKSYMSDKAKRSATNTLVEQVKKFKNTKNIGYEIWLYNSKVIGLHNYYQIATHCNIDFRSIAFVVSRALKHSIKLRRAGKTSGYINEKYGKSKQLRFVGQTPVVPIGYIQNRVPLDKRVAVNSYTAEGRLLIHKALSGVNMATMRWLMESTFKGQRAELYNNKIALYSGQNGKCFVTGKPLEIGDIHCHHKTPYYKTKDDSYSNLVLVTTDVHRLLHATKSETIKAYMDMIGPDKKQIAKINRLRKMLDLPDI